MGCDIHLVLERKFNDKWVGVQKMGYLPEKALRGNSSTGTYIKFSLAERHYDFFYGLAAVRDGDEPHREPNGFPDDASDLSIMEVSDDQDLHSHGSISLQELIPILAKRKYDDRNVGDDLNDAVATEVTATLEGSLTRRQIIDEWIDDGVELSQLDDYRLVFAFDN